jgi:glutaredoxin
MKRAFKNSIFFLTFFLSGTFLFGQETIEIYTMNGCGRCAYAIKYAKENNLNFKEYSTEQSANNSKMWSLVQNSGKFGGGSITMPVIAYKGKVAFNIKNLGEYMLKLNNENTSESSTTTNNISNESTSNDQITEILKAHNKYRAEVNIPPLKWSDDLAAYAKEWGEHLVQTGCNLEHRPFTGKWKQQYGENIYWTSGSEISPTEAVESWAEEKPDYDGGLMNNKNFAAGHYTQMIWGKTTHVGCATVKCKDGSHIVVCNYNPPGNYMGRNPLEK